jgi:hypothetical protein
MNHFVFFHVGSDDSFPSKMVTSLRGSNPGSVITMCTEPGAPKISGVDHYTYSTGNKAEIMFWRTRAFAETKLDVPAMYLDTDMLVIRPFEPARILGDKKIILCRRSFDVDCGFNGRQRGGVFMQYDGVSLGTLYPFLGCATITRSWREWSRLAELMGNGLEAIGLFHSTAYPDDAEKKKTRRTGYSD